MKNIRYILLAICILCGVSCKKEPDKTLTVEFDSPAEVVVVPGSTIFIGYTITSGTGTATMELSPSADIQKVVNNKEDEAGLKGKIRVTFGKSVTAGTTKLAVTVANEYGTKAQAFSFEAEAIDPGTVRVFEANAQGGALEIPFRTNTEFQMVIPAEAKSWLSVESTKAMSAHSVTLNLAANESFQRSAVVSLQTASGSVEEEYEIVQAGTAHIFSFTTTARKVMTPLGQDVKEARIDWGLGRGFSSWTESITHTYPLNSGAHTVTFEFIGTERVMLTTMDGVSEVDMSRL